MTNGDVRTWTDVDGYAVRIERKYDSLWICVSLPGKTGNSVSFGGAFASIEPVTQKHYIDGLRKSGRNPKDFRTVSGSLIRLTAVPFIESVIAEEKQQRAEAADELARNVPGLEQLRAAVTDRNRYARQFSRMMEDENNDGGLPPKPARASASELAAQYPIAAAYLKAESWENAAHDVKATAGKKAKDRIAAGEDFCSVLADMEAEWSGHATAHAWD